MHIAVTGGAGFIGSSITSALLDAGHTVAVIDDLSTGRREFAVDRPFYEGDFADPAIWERLVSERGPVDAVIHTAAKIVVPESVEMPLSYYDNNVAKLIDLLGLLRKHDIPRFIFSGSASIYESPEDAKVTEDSPTSAGSPYGRTKLMAEGILRDVSTEGEPRALSLRYFNPIGCDPQRRSGLQILEPTHALGKLIEAHREGEEFVVTGDDYPTRDGSGIRDYVHVWDLALAHVRAAEMFDEVLDGGTCVINLGTGLGTSVFELVEAFNRVVDNPVSWSVGERRPGDIAGAYTVSTRAREVLKWEPQFSLEQGIADSLEWSQSWRAKVL